MLPDRRFPLTFWPISSALFFCPLWICILNCPTSSPRTGRGGWRGGTCQTCVTRYHNNRWWFGSWQHWTQPFGTQLIKLNRIYTDCHSLCLCLLWSIRRFGDLPEWKVGLSWLYWLHQMKLDDFSYLVHISGWPGYFFTLHLHVRDSISHTKLFFIWSFMKWFVFNHSSSFRCSSEPVFYLWPRACSQVWFCVPTGFRCLSFEYFLQRNFSSRRDGTQKLARFVNSSLFSCVVCATLCCSLSNRPRALGRSSSAWHVCQGPTFAVGHEREYLRPARCSSGGGRRNGRRPLVGCGTYAIQGYWFTDDEKYFIKTLGRLTERLPYPSAEASSAPMAKIIWIHFAYGITHLALAISWAFVLNSQE